MRGARSTTVVVALVAVAAIGAGALALAALGPAAPVTGTATANETGLGLDGDDADLVRFEDRADFERYVRAGRQRGANGMTGGLGGRQAVDLETSGPGRRIATTDASPGSAAGDGAGGGDGGAGDGEAVTRIGTTNVQVAGLDEPDLVKAGGSTFHYAPQGRTGPRPIEPPGEPRQDVVKSQRGSVHAIDASQPAAPETLAEIDASGRLLRSGDTLVVLEGDRIRGFDVSDPENPSQVWRQDLDASLVTARERDGTVYLVTRTPVSDGPTCPVEPLDGAATVRCDEIYHPKPEIQVDVTYTALTIDAEAGEVHDSVSVVGSGRNTVVSMSPEGLYLTYTKQTGRAALLSEFLLEEADGVPADVRERIREVRSYDISPASKTREIANAVQDWLDSLPEDEGQRQREALSEGFRAFVADHQREVTTTGIVRIDVAGQSLSIGQSGTVPGRPLNQFSIGQYDGTLRVATTVPAAGDAESENDLYVLDATSLEREGSVTGMGLNERVYSVRYTDDTAYVVTFRRIDPFHVIDLSDPTNPTLEGELKLPGFSSYLHPINESYVVGVGEEDGDVKAVLFDVRDPENPTVADDLIVEEGWSAIRESHHAFTIDRRHGVFFLPAGERGLVVDYTGGDLAVETSVRTDGPAQRARYVNDYLYVFGQHSVVVLDETTWDRTTTLDLPT